MKSTTTELLLLSFATSASGFFALPKDNLPFKATPPTRLRVGVKETEVGESFGAEETFRAIDKDGSGFIDKNELKASLVALGQPADDDHIRALVEGETHLSGVDIDDLQIDLPTFLRIVGEGSELEHTDLVQMYHAVDLDASGYITGAELQHFMSGLDMYIGDDQMAGLLNMYDKDGNGRITFDEFRDIAMDLGFEIKPNDDDHDDETPRTEILVEETEEPSSNLADEVKEEVKFIDLSSIADEDLRDALAPLDADGSGSVNLALIREAAEAQMSSDNHFSPGRPMEGLAEHIKGVNHVAIIVSDVARSLKFYKSIMGFEQIRRPNFDATGAWLTMGNVELHLIKGQPLVYGGDDLVVGHISIDVDSTAAGEVIKKLQEMKVPFRKNSSVPAGADTGSMNTNANDDMMSDKITTQFFVRDPDGYYVEICNCDETLTQYCLGKKDSLPGYVEGIKPLSLKTATNTISLMQRWMKKQECRDRGVDVLAVKVKKETDGSVEQVAKLLECEKVEEVDPKILQALKDRWSIYADLWQNEEEDNIEYVLKSAGGDPKMASLIVKLRSIYCGKVVMRPPVVFNLDGTKFVPEPIVKDIKDSMPYL